MASLAWVSLHTCAASPPSAPPPCFLVFLHLHLIPLLVKFVFESSLLFTHLFVFLLFCFPDGPKSTSSVVIPACRLVCLGPPFFALIVTVTVFCCLLFSNFCFLIINIQHFTQNLVSRPLQLQHIPSEAIFDLFVCINIWVDFFYPSEIFSQVPLHLHAVSAG